MNNSFEEKPQHVLTKADIDTNNVITVNSQRITQNEERIDILWTEIKNGNHKKNGELEERLTKIEERLCKVEHYVEFHLEIEEWRELHGE